MISIAENSRFISAEIRQLERKYQRPIDSVTLLAVSKKQSVEKIRQAYNAGIRHFGESYLDEALEKMTVLGELDLCWHFIGPVQSNKTRGIAGHFHWLHSLDRLKLAQRLNDQRPKEMPVLNVCLQVNISQEQSKSGLRPDAVVDLAAAVSDLPRLRLRGLMAIPAADSDFQRQRQSFQELAHQFHTLQLIYPQLDTLSMGMSADYEAAIAEGSTVVRIGTALFGERA